MTSDRSPYSPPEASLDDPRGIPPRPLWLAVIAAMAAFVAFGMAATLGIILYFGDFEEAGTGTPPNFDAIVALLYGCTATVAGLVGAAVHRGRWLVAPFVTAGLITVLISGVVLLSVRTLSTAQLGTTAGALGVLFAGSLLGGWVARGRAP